MGSAACLNLASRGCRVLGLEQFDIVHDRGSHTGQSRIIRKAYFEHPDYVPLLERSYENWRKFEKLTSSEIYHKTGILYMGKAESEVLAGTRRSATLYDIPLVDLSFENCRNQYPDFKLPEDFDTFIEPDSGFVIPEKAITLYTDEAIKQGAIIKTNATVTSWLQHNNTVTVITNLGEFTCDKLIVTAGSWSSSLLPSLPARLKVTQQILAWIDVPDHEHFSPENFPCWFIEDDERGLFYGFPLIHKSDSTAPAGIKVAHHAPGERYDPNKVNTVVPAQAKENIDYMLEKYLPGLKNFPIVYKQCLYTYSEDGNFIIDHLPGSNERVTIACGFSGHGFKFVSAIGEVLADLAITGTTALPIDFLRLRRFR